MSTMAHSTKSRRPRRRFTEEFRAGAVRLVLDEGKTAGQVARELDLTESALRNWVDQARADRTKGRTGLLGRREAPSLAHFVRSMVGLDRAAAQDAFSEFLSNRSLSTPQIRFIEMVIDQLTVRGVMEASALYEAPFTSVHAGGPEKLFAGRGKVIEGIFETLKTLRSALLVDVG